VPTFPSIFRKRQRDTLLKSYTPPLLGGLLSLAVYQTSVSSFFLGVGLTATVLFTAAILDTLL